MDSGCPQQQFLAFSEAASASEDDLINAVLSGDVAHAESLAKLGVRVASPNTWIVVEACLHGVDMIRALTSNRHIDLNSILPEQQGDRVLHSILRMSSSRFPAKAEVVSLLLREGVDPLQPDRRGNNALHILSASADDSSVQDYGLLQSVLCGDRDIPARVHNACLAAINIRNMGGEGNTALIIAIQCDNEDVVSLLLEHGASPNAPGEFGRRPLFFAVARNYVRIAALLLNHGATIGNECVSMSSEMELVLRLYHCSIGSMPN